MTARTGLRAALAAANRRCHTTDGYAVYPLREFPPTAKGHPEGFALAVRIRNVPRSGRLVHRAGEVTILCQDEPDVDHGRSSWSASFPPEVPDAVVFAAITAAVSRPGAL